MKKTVIDLVKKNKILYSIYYYVISVFLKLIGIFIRTNSNEIVFLCFGGRTYGDNVKPIYESMLKDKRFNCWKFVWGFRNPEEQTLPESERTIKCKVDGISFFYHCLKAKCWITNVSMQRGLNFKNKETLYVNTWHGVPLKLIGEDIRDGSAFKVTEVEPWDLILTEGTYDAKIAETAFRVRSDQVKVTGYPRNDRMMSGQEEKIRKVFEQYQLDNNKKTILYAPTYRDYNRDESNGFTFDMKLSVEKFKAILGDEYQLLIRAHGAIENDSASDQGCIDVSGYPYVEDLMLAADVLVSDYSGIIFDYSLLEKPIICFIYDVEKYKKYRGFYVDIESFLPFKKCYDEDELYSAIKAINPEKSRIEARKFKDNCGLISENASSNAVDEICKAMKRKK